MASRLACSQYASAVSHKGCQAHCAGAKEEVDARRPLEGGAPPAGVLEEGRVFFLYRYE